MNDSKSEWKLDKHISIGHMLSTITIAGGLFVWGSGMEGRISSLETGFDTYLYQSARVEEQRNARIDRVEQRIERQLDRIENRLHSIDQTLKDDGP